MKHSIIIPCRNRWRNVALCVWSINRSAEACNLSGYEIIVVENCPKTVMPTMSSHEHVAVCTDYSEMPIFNKPRLQNIGIEESAGDVLTFLDADALVGKRWMENVSRLADEPTLTRFCYRVRTLPKDYGDLLADASDRAAMLDSWFSFYDHKVRAKAGNLVDGFKLRHEGYGRPERDKPGPGPIFGNSHFSIRRDTLQRLGDLRYNEEYVGRGFEDLWFIREVWLRDTDHYRAEIVTDADHAVFNIDNPDGNGGLDWWNATLNTANASRYEQSWPVKAKRLTAQMMRGYDGQLPADVALEMLEPEIANQASL